MATSFVCHAVESHAWTSTSWSVSVGRSGAKLEHGIGVGHNTNVLQDCIHEFFGATGSMNATGVEVGKILLLKSMEGGPQNLNAISLGIPLLALLTQRGFLDAGVSLRSVSCLGSNQTGALVSWALDCSCITWAENSRREVGPPHDKDTGFPFFQRRLLSRPKATLACKAFLCCARKVLLYTGFMLHFAHALPGLPPLRIQVPILQSVRALQLLQHCQRSLFCACGIPVKLCIEQLPLSLP